MSSPLIFHPLIFHPLCQSNQNNLYNHDNFILNTCQVFFLNNYKLPISDKGGVKLPISDKGGCDITYIR